MKITCIGLNLHTLTKCYSCLGSKCMLRSSMEKLIKVLVWIICIGFGRIVQLWHSIGSATMFPECPSIGCAFNSLIWLLPPISARKWKRD